MPLGTEVALGPDHSVLDGDPDLPSAKRGQSPQFSAHVYCDQTAGWIKMALGMEVGLCPGHIVLDGDSAPLHQKGAEPPPNFRLIFTVAKRLDASRCHLVWRYASTQATVLDGDPAPSFPKKGQSPQFSAHVYCGQTAPWIKTPLGTKVGLGPTRHCVRWGPSSPPLHRHSAPNFRPMSVVAKQLDGLRCHLVWR